MSLPRYPEYKDSGVEWLGEVPAHWDVLALKRVASISYGIGEPPQYRPDGIPLIRATNVHNGHIYESGLVFVDPEDIPEKRIFWLQAGDIIVVRSGAYTGDSATILEKHCPAIAGFDMILRPQNCDSAFLQFSLLSFYLKEQQIDLAKMRAAQPHLNAEELGSCVLIHPELAEQKSIAAFLHTETAKIDALIAEQERLIALLKEKRQAVISHAVTKGLNPDVPMKESGVEWLGQVPAHWTVTRLKFLAQVRSGVAKGRDIAIEHAVEVPYLRVANVQDGYLDLDDVARIQIAAHELDRYRLLPGDVLMNEGGDFDKLGRGHVWRGEIDDCIHQNHVFAVRPHGVEPEWISLLTSAHAGRFYFMSRSKQSTNLASISSSNIAEFTMPLPPVAERAAIVAVVTTEVQRINDLLAQAASAITLLQERRSALISAAVTGKIDVRGLAPASGEAA